MDKKFLTIGETAKMLGVSVDTLRRWDKEGILNSVRSSKKGHRYYSEQDVYLFGKDLFDLAEEWALREVGIEPESSLYCSTNDVFQNRLVGMQNLLAGIPNLSTPFSLIVALVGEIGNNSFDHNLGNWRDIPGVFFGYNIEKKYIVLADRGQGLLRTLQRVKPNLKTHDEAMQVAFTDVISGRAPESRGNGLKFVKNIITTNPLNLLFESGDAKLVLQKGDLELRITEKIPPVHGCVAMLEF
ncbi:MAG: MerR family transcriptional regulator [Candidatus Gracilibacteria bacterium]